PRVTLPWGRDEIGEQGRGLPRSEAQGSPGSEPGLEVSQQRHAELRHPRARCRLKLQSGAPNSTTAGEMITLLSTNLQRPAGHHLTNVDPQLGSGHRPEIPSGGVATL